MAVPRPAPRCLLTIRALIRRRRHHLHELCPEQVSSSTPLLCFSASRISPSPARTTLAGGHRARALTTQGRAKRWLTRPCPRWPGPCSPEAAALAPSPARTTPTGARRPHALTDRGRGHARRNPLRRRPHRLGLRAPTQPRALAFPVHASKRKKRSVFFISPDAWIPHVRCTVNIQHQPMERVRTRLDLSDTRSQVHEPRNNVLIVEGPISDTSCQVKGSVMNFPLLNTHNNMINQGHNKIKHFAIIFAEFQHFFNFSYFHYAKVCWRPIQIAVR